VTAAKILVVSAAWSFVRNPTDRIQSPGGLIFDHINYPFAGAAKGALMKINFMV
jgi:hypothetical protein